MYQVLILPKAISGLAKIDKHNARKITEKLKWFSENIETLELSGLKGGFSGLYKLKVSDYRVIYEVNLKGKIITVHKIGHRKDIYK